MVAEKNYKVAGPSSSSWSLLKHLYTPSTLLDQKHTSGFWSLYQHHRPPHTTNTDPESEIRWIKWKRRIKKSLLEYRRRSRRGSRSSSGKHVHGYLPDWVTDLSSPRATPPPRLPCCCCLVCSLTVLCSILLLSSPTTYNTLEYVWQWGGLGGSLGWFRFLGLFFVVLYYYSFDLNHEEPVEYKCIHRCVDEGEEGWLAIVILYYTYSFPPLLSWAAAADDRRFFFLAHLQSFKTQRAE